MTAAHKMPIEPQPAAELDADGLEHGDEWEAEVQRRAEEVREGRVQAVPREEVAAKIRAKYGWR